MKNFKQHQGFTIVELMITIAVAAILLTIAVPNMTKFIWSNRIVTTSNDMVFLITLARSEAIKRNKEISIAKKGSGPATDWSGGAILFLDKDGNGVFDNKDERIHELPAVNNGLSLKMIAPAFGSKYMKFSPIGALSFPSSVEFGVCENNDILEPNYERQLKIGVSGRPKVSVASSDPCP